MARQPPTPNWPWPPHCRGFSITHNDTPQSVRLLWTTDQPVAETSTCSTHNTHNRQTFMSPGGIRTRNSSKPAATDPHLRPRGHCDRNNFSWYYAINFQVFQLKLADSSHYVSHNRRAVFNHKQHANDFNWSLIATTLDPSFPRHRRA